MYLAATLSETEVHSEIIFCRSFISVYSGEDLQLPDNYIAMDIEQANPAEVEPINWSPITTGDRGKCIQSTSNFYNPF
jgi:hypothetical protein